MLRNKLTAISLLALALGLCHPVHALCAPAPSPVKPASASQPAGKNTLPEDSGAWRREPFKPLEGPKQPAGQTLPGALQLAQPDLLLQGIMKSGNRYYAIVNGRTVRAGDRIEGWTVSGISRYQAVFRRDKEKAIYDIYQGKTDRGNR